MARQKNCKNCGEYIPCKIKIDGKVRNLGTRKYCLNCSPFGSGNTRKIEIAKFTKGTVKERTEERKKRDNKKYKKWQRKARKERKIKLIIMLGGKCSKCGYNKNYAALDFHHKNMDEKEEKSFGVSSKGMLSKWSKLVEETKKCVLLCANCHREEHNKICLLPDGLNNCNSQQITFCRMKSYFEPKEEPKKYYCKCGKEVWYGSKMCSVCSHKKLRRVERPAKEELIKLIRDKPVTHIGKIFGVSDNAVRKWAKHYGIDVKAVKKSSADRVDNRVVDYK